jgi:hypothetical protein
MGCPAEAGLLYDKAAVLGDTIKGALFTYIWKKPAT